MRAVLVVGVLALALAACGDHGAAERKAAAEQTTADQAAADFAAAVAPPPALLSHTSVEIYPSAVEVRLMTFDSSKAEGEKEVDHGRLTGAQRRAVERTISIANYGPGTATAAACFVPHHFLQYFDANGQKVGEIAICFCCAGIRSDPMIEAPLPPGAETSDLTFDYEALKAVFKSMGVPTDIACAPGEG